MHAAAHVQRREGGHPVVERNQASECLQEAAMNCQTMDLLERMGVVGPGKIWKKIKGKRRREDNKNENKSM